MSINKIEDSVMFKDTSPTKVISMGHIVDLTVSEHISSPKTKKLDKHSYINMDTGEIKEYNHIKNRSESFQSLRRTMDKIRALINTNATNMRNIRWITLTYRENMTDNNQLYHDYEKFWKRFCYYCEKMCYPKPEYISVVEPQGRGAWHIHALFIWNTTAPFIANETLADLWTHGFVSIKQPSDCDNLGAYFSAYLTNMPAEEVSKLPKDEQISAYVAASTRDKEFNNFAQDKTEKRIIKGARMALYPPGMNIVRHSRGIKKPTIQRMSLKEALEYVSDAQQTYIQVYEISDDDGNTVNHVLKSSFNFKRKREQK